MAKTLIVIAGPTASGKTTLAMQIAKHYDTKIINADSRQCYKELNIGVAKPSNKELTEVPHYFVNSHSVTENINAGDFERLGLQYLESIFATNDYAILSGGSGLYIKALCQGMDDMPEINKTIDDEVNEQYKLHGITYLQTEIKLADASYYKNGEIHNPARLLRALVFARSTGQSIINFQKKTTKPRDFEIKYYCIDMPRIILYENINTRVDIMMQEGLLEEVKNLLPYKAYKNLQTVGYSELFSYLNNECTLAEAIALLKQNTRRYAKRQITWFKKQYPDRFFEKENIFEVIIKEQQ
jgi:tRNA dimethylallyltransferase